MESSLLIENFKLPEPVREQVSLVRRTSNDLEADALLHSIAWILRYKAKNEAEIQIQKLVQSVVARVMRERGYVKSIHGRWILRTERFVFWANIVLCFVFTHMTKYILETGGSVKVMFWMLGLSFFAIFVNRKHALESVKILYHLCRRKKNI